MCLIKRFNKAAFILGVCVLMFIIGVAHFVLGLMMKVNEFNVFDLFDSSPLFDFSISDNCGDKSALTFHRWGGKKEVESYRDKNNKPKTKITIYDETDIKK